MLTSPAWIWLVEAVFEKVGVKQKVFEALGYHLQARRFPGQQYLLAGSETRLPKFFPQKTPPQKKAGGAGRSRPAFSSARANVMRLLESWLRGRENRQRPCWLTAMAIGKEA